MEMCAKMSIDNTKSIWRKGGEHEKDFNGRGCCGIDYRDSDECCTVFKRIRNQSYFLVSFLLYLKKIYYVVYLRKRC